MKISNRIQALASVIECDVLADIGTDHAYVPVCAIKAGGASRAIACDINPQPLERARRNIQAAGLSGRIETRLGDGFAPIAPGEADAAVIAGLGGMLMIDILNDGASRVRELSLLVLSPQSDVPAVRRHIHATGFCVAGESMVYEDGKYYNIIRGVPGSEEAYSADEYELGRRLIQECPPVFIDYIRGRKAALERVKRQITRRTADCAQSEARLFEIEQSLRLYGEILKRCSDFGNIMLDNYENL